MMDNFIKFLLSIFIVCIVNSSAQCSYNNYQPLNGLSTYSNYASTQLTYYPACIDTFVPATAPIVPSVNTEYYNFVVTSSNLGTYLPISINSPNNH